VLGDELQVLIPLGRGCLGCFVVLAHMIQEGALESVRMAPVAKFWRSRLVRHIGRLCSCGSEGPGANSRSSICESEQTRQMAILHTFAVTRPYWDGGYSANPPVIALVEASDASDMLIVQIMPTAGQELPVSSSDIVKRLDQVTFKGVLLREAAALTAMARAVGSGSQDPASSRKLQRLRLHHISAEREQSELSEASGGNLKWQFLLNLRQSGRAAADTWLAQGIREPRMREGRLRSAE
jgi:hypothetical protein